MRNYIREQNKHLLNS